MLLAVAAIALAVGAAFVMRRGPASPPHARSVAEALPAARAALHAGRYREAVEAFGLASDAGLVRTWEDHFDHAIALHDLTLLYRQQAGQQVAATTSSVERVRMFQRELREYELALAAGPGPRDQADILHTRAEALYVWGLAWEAFISFRNAQAADPGDSVAAARADMLQDMLASPVRSGRASPARTE